MARIHPIVLQIQREQRMRRPRSKALVKEKWVNKGACFAQGKKQEMREGQESYLKAPHKPAEGLTL